MTKEQFEQVKTNLDQFSFTSLNYTEYGEVADYELLVNNSKAIIMYGFNPESGMFEYHWACNNKEDLLDHLKRRNESEKITFVPKDWISSLESIGFGIYAIWNDYVATELEKFANTEEPIFVDFSNAQEASHVTRACIGQSRGFTGQSEKWIKQWIMNKEPAVPDYTDNCAIIAEYMDEMAGVICVGTYESGDKTILWIREVAVKPDYQGKGIGRKLMGKAFAYGLKHGASKAFLMADECNDNALHLYKSMGFKAVSDESQIDMVR